MARIAILCGLPLSGKSTFARKLKQDSWVVVCPDTVRLALHGQEFNKQAESFVWASCELMVRTLLRSDYSVVVDATNTTKERRAMWLGIAREFGLELTAFVIDTPVEVCHQRNKERLPSLPSNVIDRMATQWEPVNEPELQVIEVAG